MVTANLIWLTLALESLLGSPRTEIATTLRKRLFLIFGPAGEEATAVRKALQDLYDLRSRFVHGQLPIPITTDNELLAEELYARRERILGTTTIGTRIVVALLQELVKRSWRTVDADTWVVVITRVSGWATLLRQTLSPCRRH
jgi:hypothetical protein